MSPSPPGRDDDTSNGESSDDDGGQVSEMAAMTPEVGADDTPGTDDGVPAAGDSDTEPGGAPPKSYGD